MRDDIKQQEHAGWQGGNWHRPWHEAHHMRGRWHGGHGGRGPGRGWPGFFGPGGPRGGGQWGDAFGGGHGGRERLERGLLRYIILDVLNDGPKHG